MLTACCLNMYIAFYKSTLYRLRFFIHLFPHFTRVAYSLIFSLWVVFLASFFYIIHNGREQEDITLKKIKYRVYAIIKRCLINYLIKSTYEDAIMLLLNNKIRKKEYKMIVFTARFCLIHVFNSCCEEEIHYVP